MEGGDAVPIYWQDASNARKMTGQKCTGTIGKARAVWRRLGKLLQWEGGGYQGVSPVLQVVDTGVPAVWIIFPVAVGRDDEVDGGPPVWGSSIRS